MDLDQLSLAEAAQMSKLIELLGVPADTMNLEGCIRTLEATTTLYRKQLHEVRTQQRNHGE